MSRRVLVPHEPKDSSATKRAIDTMASYAWRLLVIAAAVWASLWLVGQLLVVIVPLVGALLLARGLSPVAGRLRRSGCPVGLAAAITMIGFLTVLAAVVWLAGSRFVAEIDELGAAASETADDLENWIADNEPLGITSEDFDRLRMDFGSSSEDFLTNSGDSLVSGAVLAGEVVLGTVLALIVCFFLLKDAESFRRAILRLIAPRHRGLAKRLGDRAWEALGGYLRAAATLGAVESVVIGIAVAAVGARLLIPVMVVTFLGAFVPIIGSITAGLIAVLAAYVSAGTTAAVIVGIVALVVQQLDNDILAPLIYGRAMKIHALGILISLTAGGALFGLIGTLLAVPVLAVGVNVIDEVRNNRDGRTHRSEVIDGDGRRLSTWQRRYSRRRSLPPSEDGIGPTSAE